MFLIQLVSIPKLEVDKVDTCLALSHMHLDTVLV